MIDHKEKNIEVQFYNDPDQDFLNLVLKYKNNVWINDKGFVFSKLEKTLYKEKIEKFIKYNKKKRV